LSSSGVEKLSTSLKSLGAALSSFLSGRGVPATAASSPPDSRPTAHAPAVLFRHAAAVGKLAPVERRPYDGPGRRLFRPVPVRPFCSATYASIERTCSEGCPFKRDGKGGVGGCFANSGFTKFAINRLDAAARDRTAISVAQEEADAIDRAWPAGVPQDGAGDRGRDLRLHVAGDVRSTAGAKLLAEASQRWLERGGGTPWTYSHSWREIPAAAWGVIQVLASVESNRQVRQAARRGYAAAIVVAEFPNGDRAFDVGGGFKAIPCPAETRGTTCVACRLCLDRDLLGMKRAIAFRAHGMGIAKALVAISEAT
jgi:hypothetical protein